MSVIDRCWSCDTNISDDDNYIEITLNNDSEPLGTLHRACQGCSVELPGVNEDNIRAILDPEH